MSVSFEIWQLKREFANKYLLKDMREWRKDGITPNCAMYNLVYAGENETDNLDDIYEGFNDEIPQGFVGHSLRVSDVIVIRDEKDAQAYFINTWGFVEVEDFFEMQGMEAPIDFDSFADVIAHLEERSDIRKEMELVLNAHPGYFNGNSIPYDVSSEFIIKLLETLFRLPKDEDGQSALTWWIDRMNYGHSITRGTQYPWIDNQKTWRPNLRTKEGLYKYLVCIYNKQL